MRTEKEETDIIDSERVVTKLVEEAKRCQKLCMVFKVDYEKVYDSVSGEFLIYMMRR